MASPARLFPVLLSPQARRGSPVAVDCPGGVPWDMVAPHEAQAKFNHGGQSLLRLAERGGLAPCELLAVLRDRRWHAIPLASAVRQLVDAVAAWEEERQRDLLPRQRLPEPDVDDEVAACLAACVAPHEGLFHLGLEAGTCPSATEEEEAHEHATIMRADALIERSRAALAKRRAIAPPRSPAWPDCPGPGCLACSGEACNKCGAGLNVVPGRPRCEHDVAQRHEDP